MQLKEISELKGSVTPKFNWEDPLLIDTQLSEEEKIIQKTARDYAEKELMPRILEANRHEKFDREIYNEMGNLGILGPTISGYGCPGVGYTAYGIITREI